MKKIILILFLFNSFFLLGQQTRVDTLKQILKEKNLTDSIYFDVLIELSDIYSYHSTDTALFYAMKAKQQAKKINNIKRIVQADIEIGWHNYSLGRYKEAIAIYNKALENSEKIGYKKGVAISYGNLASVYKDIGNYRESLDYNFKLLKFAEESGIKNLEATANGNIALVYHSLSNFEKAKNYTLKALELDKMINNEKGIARNYGNLALIYETNKNIDSAFKYYNKALKIDIKNNNKFGVARHLGNLSSYYFSKKEYAKSSELLNEAIQIDTELENEVGLARNIGLLGICNLKIGNIKEAEEQLITSLKLATKIENLEIQKQVQKSLSDFYYETADYKKAIDYYYAYEKSQESINYKENTQNSIQKELEYNYLKKTATDSIANAKKQEIKNAEIAKQKAELKAKRNQQYALFGGVIMSLLFLVFVYNRLKTSEKQKKIIELKHKEITDSINYAERIQRSFLATKEFLDINLQDYFVFFQPKDVVSGDFYWAGKLNNGNFAFSCADSTGHGVPGAIMSILNISSLEKAIELQSEPHLILNTTRKIIIDRLRKDGSSEGGKDGMDCSLLVLNPERSELSFAMANNPVFIIRNKELIEFKPDRMPVGKHDNDVEPFTLHTFKTFKGDIIYAITDGFHDQFGGNNGKKYMIKNLKKLLVTIASLPMDKQKEFLNSEFLKWKGTNEQVDDVCIIGVRI